MFIIVQLPLYQSLATIHIFLVNFSSIHPFFFQWFIQASTEAASTSSTSVPHLSYMWMDSDDLGDEGGALMSMTRTPKSCKRTRASNIDAALNRIANTMEQMPKAMCLAAAWNQGRRVGRKLTTSSVCWKLMVWQLAKRWVLTRRDVHRRLTLDGLLSHVCLIIT